MGLLSLKFLNYICCFCSQFHSSVMGSICRLVTTMPSTLVKDEKPDDDVVVANEEIFEKTEELIEEVKEEVSIKTDDKPKETSKLPEVIPTVCNSKFLKYEAYIMPLVFTALAIFTRMYRIGACATVTWDEAHFGKFGSYYLRHEFYHDVHPPLGKMLVGLSGYLAGYNGSWDFPSGQDYPDYIDFVKMRMFNAAFSAMCVPFAYFTAKAIGYSLPSVWLFTIMVLFENSYATLGRFILLDSMLLFFTVTSMFSFVMYHNQRKNPFGRKWWKWMLITGLNLGCVISVKMVGLFMIMVVGIYTFVDLWTLMSDKKISWKAYAGHWLARIICLIIAPCLVFMFCFKIHFDLLTNSGTGDAMMPSLFQANLNGSKVRAGPRDVALGSSIISIKNQNLGGALLHSHYQTYPVGSQQQQVTGYGYQDENNEWSFQRVRSLPTWNNEETEIEYIQDGEVYRIVHTLSGKNLHSHQVQAPVSVNHYEVTGYGNLKEGDDFDYWMIEIVKQLGSEDAIRLHPLSTSFRVKHVKMGCYLAQSGLPLPEWGFKQAEIICMKNPSKSDPKTIWNIESHVNELLPPVPEDFKYPQSGFFKNFFHLNMAMMATNNALVPDPEKNDYISSSWWQWPTLHTGLRLGRWSDERVRYYLLGTPITTWASTVAVLLFMALVIVLAVRWQRQYEDLQDESDSNLFIIGGIYPMFGWGLNYTPFIIMGRVTYLHHYLPALYFALLVLSYFIEVGTSRITNQKVRLSIFAILMISVIGCFALFSPISFGMEGPDSEYKYLNWVSSWNLNGDK